MAKPMTQEVKNEDGTVARVPGNPLQHKWAKKYPPMSQDCEGYACKFCGVCPRGGKWRVPAEDRAVWERHKREVEEYIAKHNGSVALEHKGHADKGRAGYSEHPKHGNPNKRDNKAYHGQRKHTENVGKQHKSA